MRRSPPSPDQMGFLPSGAILLRLRRAGALLHWRTSHAPCPGWPELARPTRWARPLRPFRVRQSPSRYDHVETRRVRSSAGETRPFAGCQNRSVVAQPCTCGCRKLPGVRNPDQNLEDRQLASAATAFSGFSGFARAQPETAAIRPHAPESGRSAIHQPKPFAGPVEKPETCHFAEMNQSPPSGRQSVSLNVRLWVLVAKSRRSAERPLAAVRGVRADARKPPFLETALQWQLTPQSRPYEIGAAQHESGHSFTRRRHCGGAFFLHCRLACFERNCFSQLYDFASAIRSGVCGGGNNGLGSAYGRRSFCHPR